MLLVLDSVILKMAAATYSKTLITIYRNTQRSGCEQRTFRLSDFFFPAYLFRHFPNRVSLVFK